MTELIAEISAALARVDGVYVAPAIPAKKLMRAAAACRIASSVHVIGLVDCTVFGSAKYATLFADRVYICDAWTAELLGGVVVVPYEELAALEVTSATVRFPARGLETPRRNIDRTALAALQAVQRVVVLASPPPASAAPPSSDRKPEPDLGENPDVIALKSAIAAAPDDDAPQLVLADLLMTADDPRGELIVLDNRERETPGGLTDPEALERYLLLAAAYGFPRATPEEPMLGFTTRGNDPRRRIAYHQDTSYEVDYRNSTLTVTANGQDSGRWRLDTQWPDRWTVDEEIVILRLLSDAIRARTPLPALVFPFMRDPLPIYDGGMLRGYRLPARFTKPRNLANDAFGLAPRDFERWNAIWKRLRQQRAGE